MTKKSPENSANKPTETPTPTPTTPPAKKKKLSLDISDVSEVLERKISP